MARRSGPVLELLVDVDRAAAEPLHTQLERQLRDAIRAGRLNSGTTLPSSRTLAADLGIARAVVVEAYAQLAAEGYLETRHGSGTTVAPAPARLTPRTVARDKPRAADYDFHPGRPDLDTFPIADWCSCAQDALRTAPRAVLGYADPQGLPRLREALAEYLGRTRGTIVDPDRVVICDGLTQGLGLACRALLTRGARRVAVEDPGFRFHREIIRHIGLEPVPVPVDDGGIRVDALERESIDAVLATPAHQFPTGYALSTERRVALLDWAARTGALVIEDDYDAPYRYDGRPAAAIQGVAPDHVVYAGTASKILAPGLRLGWLLVPAAISEAVVGEKAREDLGTNVPAQLALALFIERGHLDRHVRRVRLTYRTRRDVLVDALATYLPDARIEGIAAGLHTMATLPDEIDETSLRERARGRGVAIDGLSRYRATPESGGPGLVLGYANLPEVKIRRGIEQVAVAHGADG